MLGPPGLLRPGRHLAAHTNAVASPHCAHLRRSSRESLGKPRKAYTSDDTRNVKPNKDRMSISTDMKSYLEFIDELRTRGVAYCKVDGLEVNLYPNTEPGEPPEEPVDPPRKMPDILAQPIDEVGYRGFTPRDLYGSGE